MQYIHDDDGQLQQLNCRNYAVTYSSMTTVTVNRIEGMARAGLNLNT